jgi:CRISPR/Cas system CSM-associated protein Csm2 small subunit
MDERVRIDIIRVLDDSSRMIERSDIIGLKEVSNHTIHNASIFQDEDSVTVAVIMYTLAKIFERENKSDKTIVPIINSAKKNLFENNYEVYKENMRKLYDMIKTRDEKNKLYIQEVIEKAGVKKSSLIYEHGVSMGQAASILGVSQWELMEYVGKTNISDTFEPLNLKKRLSVARKLFGGN